MSTAKTDCRWTPLAALGARFEANLTALTRRYPALAATLRTGAGTAYHISGDADGITLGRADGGAVRPLPSALPAAKATATVAELCPGGYTDPVLVAGEDQGWLWDQLYRLPCRSHAGHRPPLYLATADLERLRVILHVQDWRQMLADPRVRLFAGPDAIERLGRSLAEDATLAWPARWVTVDPSFWPAGVDVDTVQAAAVAVRRRAWGEMTAAAPAAEAAAVAARVAGGRPLRVIGFTSRYTTFLQHSMRDWLAAFAALGHTARLEIEAADHQTSSPLQAAAACDAFRPDLVLLLDHYRAEFPGLPAHVPVAMWVQDHMPTIYDDAAGAAQGRLDFCLGFGRLPLTERHGYPAERFLSCPVGTNTDRFAPRCPTPAEADRYGCDVSYVSHASETADALVAEQCRRLVPGLGRVLTEALARMRQHYAADARILSDVLLRELLAASEAATGCPVDGETRDSVVSFLGQRVNNALVRHDALVWLAELGVDLRIYGRGWDRHPRLARYARGEADNRTDLAAIYRCSAVNLQVTPYGAVHQRVLDGLSAGGFFLARWNQGDEMGLPYRRLWDFCRSRGVRDDADLRRRATPAIAAALARLDDLQGYDLAAAGVSVFDAVRTLADADFGTLGDAVWGEDYDRIAFRDRAELQAKVTAALADPAGRREVAGRMRAAVVDRFSYRAISGRLLDLIGRSVATPLKEAA